MCGHADGCSLTSVTPEETDGRDCRRENVRAWLKDEVIHLAVLASRVPGLLVLLVASYWTAIGLSTYLGKVFVTGGGGMIQPTGSSLGWAAMTGVSALGLVLITRPSRWYNSIDLVGLFGAGWTLGWTTVFSWFFYSLEFWDPERRCQYRSCWPGAFQPVLVAAPLAVACLLVAAMATFGCRRSWRVRALVPAGAYVALIVAQVATWDRLVLPIFTSPPPW